jgi:hypothetical protein
MEKLRKDMAAASVTEQQQGGSGSQQQQPSGRYRLHADLVL